MITIIGAGPAGCYTAYQLAKNGKEVQVFEDHNKIGEPVQCTGLVTPAINDIIQLRKDCIVNKVETAKAIAPDGNSLEVPVNDLVLDRIKFDQYLADLAVKAGAKIYLNHKFIEYKKDAIIRDLKNKKTKNIKTDILIGADGPNSPVAKSLKLEGKREYYTGLQARIRHKTDTKIFEAYLGSVCPEFFAWIVPESDNICRVGLAAKKNTASYFEKFLNKISKNKSAIIEKQGGLIPIHNSELQIQKDNIYLVGDAAHQVKASTGGGIVQGLIAANALSDSIINKKDYAAECRNLLGKDLWLHLTIRKILDNFSDEDYNRLISLVNKDHVKYALENFNRDHPTKFMFRLVLKEPRLLYFSRKAIPYFS